MGYRSDVGLVVVLKDWDDLQEVLAVYKMHPNVQKERGCLTIGQSTNVSLTQMVIVVAIVLWSTSVVVVKINDVKWYDEYDDVQAFRQLFTIVEQFGKEREGFKYAYKELTVGEDGAT